MDLIYPGCFDVLLDSAGLEADSIARLAPIGLALEGSDCVPGAGGELLPECVDPVGLADAGGAGHGEGAEAEGADVVADWPGAEVFCVFTSIHCVPAECFAPAGALALWTGEPMEDGPLASFETLPEDAEPDADDWEEETAWEEPGYDGDGYDDVPDEDDAFEDTDGEGYAYEDGFLGESGYDADLYEDYTYAGLEPSDGELLADWDGEGDVAVREERVMGAPDSGEDVRWVTPRYVLFDEARPVCLDVAVLRGGAAELAPDHALFEKGAAGAGDGGVLLAMAGAPNAPRVDASGGSVSPGDTRPEEGAAVELEGLAILEAPPGTQDWGLAAESGWAGPGPDSAGGAEAPPVAAPPPQPVSWMELPGGESDTPEEAPAPVPADGLPEGAPSPVAVPSSPLESGDEPLPGERPTGPGAGGTASDALSEPQAESSGIDPAVSG